MTPEDILKHPANVLSQSQREFYVEQGYLKVEDAIPQARCVLRRRPPAAASGAWG